MLIKQCFVSAALLAAGLEMGHTPDPCTDQAQVLMTCYLLVVEVMGMRSGVADSQVVFIACYHLADVSGSGVGRDQVDAQSCCLLNTRIGETLWFRPGGVSANMSL